MKTRTLTIFGTLAFAIVSLVAISVISGNSHLASICSINQASAQDSPCLAQDATISALELQILDERDAVATVLFEQEVKFQATITALESGSQSEAPSEQGAAISSTSGLPFVESFDDNSHGWDLTENEAGVARLSQGKLLVTVNQSSTYWQPIPNLLVDNFYIETTITDFRYGVGFGLGDGASRNYHRFILDDTAVSYYDNQELIFSTQYPDIRATTDTVVLGLESLNGIYTLYVDGVPTDSIQITPYGNQIGVIAVGFYSASAAFDDIVVRDSR